MALVPVANGIDALIAGFGINVLDIGSNTFTIALRVQNSVDGFVGGVIPSPTPLGISTNSIPGSTVSAILSGAVLVNAFYLTDDAVGAGPQDQITVRLMDTAGEIKKAEVHLVPFQNLVDGAGQLGTACAVAFLEAGHQYRLDVTTVNISGNLDLGASGQAGAAIVPLIGGVNVVAPGVAAHHPM
jgi:hypothetical protein